MKNSKQAFVRSVIALVLCVSMFVGTTFAWFTDEVVSVNNIIQTGILDVELEWFDEDTGAWKDVDQSTNVFAENSLWEPGYTEVVYLRVRNAGNLALKYQLGVRVASQTQGINVNDEPFLLSDYIYMGVATENIGENSFYADRDAARAAITSSNSLTSGKTVNGEMLKDEADEYFALVVYMPESVGNEANYKVGTTQPTINLGITLLATQMTAEGDAFGPDYDTDATFPVLKPGSVTVPVTPGADNRLTEDVAMVNEEGTISAVVPAGTLLNPGTTSLTFSVSELSATASNVVLKENEVLRPMDVHIEGVAAGNTTPIQVTIKEAAMPGLNSGNYALYHVENGATNEMTDGALNAHNGFAYDPATGDVKLSMATFSEFALVADTENAWNGNFDYSWYTNAVAPIDGETVTEYIIANADQLAAFGAIVGGMNGQTKDSFDGKTVKLIADINLGDKDNANTSLIFHPIGYYYTDDKNADGTTGDYYSTVYSFKGTFDGNGHTIANFYQNTWEIKGDYDGNYYDVAMGLFGYVVNGTVKNLTVDNFSSDGEFTPTGVIAAYAVNSTFENIAITNCNPRVYNTGNGGIVGIGGNDNDSDSYKLTFKNITIDNTNKITALWGSWDVACGGLVGMFRGAGHVYMTNCHVAAQMDVYNDVCGNYQYYWYRYSGMMIGTNKNMTTDKDGYTVPETSKFHAEKCTVHFGTWNDYYYCELVANSLASYTHDHQFSRLVEIKAINGTTITYLDGTTGTVPASGRANYVIVNGEEGTDKAKCYHFVDGDVWDHENAGKEIVNGKEVLKEDNQHIYLPFNQLFTGYGWGVKHIPVYNGEDYAFEGITILDREVANSVVKFETKFTGDFLYRVGNKNVVSLGSLFELAADVPTALKNISSSSVWVTIEKFDDDMNVSGTYTKSTTTNWTDAKIQFSGTGVVKLTIQDYNFCKPTVLYLEVVDATNHASATIGSLGSGNVALLCNTKLNNNGALALQNASLYGNGFEIDVSAGRVTGESITANYLLYLNNAILDNVQVKGAVYTSFDIISSNSYNNPTVLSIGNSKIVNSLITNCASPVRVRSGNLEIINTTLKGGYFANLDIRGGNIILDNVTTINQVNLNDKSSDGKEIAGLGVVFYFEGPSTDTTVEIRNALTQHNYISEEYKASLYTDMLLNEIFGNDAYALIRYTDADGKKWANAGIVSLSDAVLKDNIIITGQTNKDSFVGMSISYTYQGVRSEGYLYTTKPNAPTENYTYKPAGNYEIIPKVSFDHAVNEHIKQDGSDTSCTTDANTGAETITFAAGDSFEWNTQILKSSNKAITYTVWKDGVKCGNSIVFDESGSHTIVFKYSDANNYRKNAKGEIEKYTVEYETSMEIVVNEMEATAKNAEITFPLLESYGTTKVTVDGKTYIMPNLTGTNIPKYGDDLTFDANTRKYGSLKADGKTSVDIYYPIIKTEMSGNYMVFPVFGNKNGTLVQIRDYADNGTGDPLIPYNASTQTLPAGLSVSRGYTVQWATDKDVVGSGSMNYGSWTNGTLAFKYQSSSDTIACQVMSNYLSYYPNINLRTNDRNEQVMVAEYKYVDNKGDTYYYCVGYHIEERNNGYAFGKTVPENTGGGCVTGDTLVTLADGTQKRADQITYQDQLLVWDFYKGEYAISTPSAIYNYGNAEYTVTNLHFSDGTTVKMLIEHEFFDVNANQFVYISEQNVSEFVGHTFTKVNNGQLEEVVLEGYSYATEYTGCYTILTAVHYNCFVENMLSLTSDPSYKCESFFRIFEVGEGMKYNEKKMQADIEKYGLYTYEDYAPYVTYEEYVAFGGAYFKVLVGKGLLTFEDILLAVATYAP